jgi:uncharacterized protein (TIGR02246 family)
MTPEDFPKAFATAFAAQDRAALVAMLAPDAQVITLTGALAETAEQAALAFDQEFAGIFAGVKLVTGRNRLRTLGQDGALVHQRFVVMAARDQTGRELPRFGAAMTAVLLARDENWQVVSLSLSALT